MLQQTEENSTIHHRSANAVTLLVNALTVKKEEERERERLAGDRVVQFVDLRGVYFITAGVVL